MPLGRTDITPAVNFDLATITVEELTSYDPAFCELPLYVGSELINIINYPPHE